MADAMLLAAFLERAKLSKHLASLEEAGCADAADLAEAADDDLADCGLKKMELKRLRRTLTELGFGGSSPSLAAAVVAGAGAAVLCGSSSRSSGAYCTARQCAMPAPSREGNGAPISLTRYAKAQYAPPPSCCPGVNNCNPTKPVLFCSLFHHRVCSFCLENCL